MNDLLVVGLDTDTQRAVRVGDASKEVWKSKGYHRNETLVCLHCFEGDDGIAPGTRVPLIYRGKIRGKRRAHFAHPKGFGPRSGRHSPETVWHANAKIEIATWAQSLPDVMLVDAESWTPDRKRRTDVAVYLTDGTRLSFEAQRSEISDDNWLERHNDYAAIGAVDIWLWHPAKGVPGICFGTPQARWQLSEDLARIGIPIAPAHRSETAFDPAVIDLLAAAHYPPCPDDQAVTEWHPLREMLVCSGGLGLPPSVRTSLDQSAKAAHQARMARLKAISQKPTSAVIKERMPATTTRQAIPTQHNAAAANTPVATRSHKARRIDGCPPTAPMERRRYRCQEGCGILDSSVFADGTHELVAP